ncbi:MAG: histidine phosphatase family protein [Pseudomonadota bacterium]
MARVIAALIRHGDYQQLADTPSALQPFPLNDEGRAQAREAIQELTEIRQQHGWVLHPLIDTSRLLRAWQTASLMANEIAAGSQLDLRIESYDDLAERSVGSAANMTIRQIESVIAMDPRFPDPPADWKSNSHYRLPLQGAESLLDAGRRVADHLEQSLRQLAGQCQVDTLKLFVGHGAAFRHAAHHLGILTFEQIAQLSMFHCRPVFIERLDSRHWRHIAGDWKLRKRHESFTD